MKAYKIVKKSNGKYISCGSGLEEGHALVLEYKEGEITVAWEGTVGIFIFTDLQDALSCYNERNLDAKNYGLFEVKTLSNTFSPKKFIEEIYYLQGFIFNRLVYHQKLVSPTPYMSYTIPHGTKVCQKIRVGKLIKGGTDESL
ncbi:MAG: hypothetical protein ABFC98_03135 [Candidatus Cloacimonas sp.]